jgi:hypothetical protein
VAKQRKNNYLDVPPVPSEAIAAVGGEEDFVELLRRELEWPIPMTVQRLADVAIPHELKEFGFNPEEDRIAVSRLLNLTEDQPWGVFLFEFKTKRPYLSHLRRLLRVLGSQRTLRKGDPIWNRSDLLFICTSDWSPAPLSSPPEMSLPSLRCWPRPRRRRQGVVKGGIWTEFTQLSSKPWGSLRKLFMTVTAHFGDQLMTP